MNHTILPVGPFEREMLAMRIQKGASACGLSDRGYSPAKAEDLTALDVRSGLESLSAAIAESAKIRPNCYLGGTVFAPGYILGCTMSTTLDTI